MRVGRRQSTRAACFALLALIAELTGRSITVHVDRALIGSFAVSLEDGLTTTDAAEAYTKELVLGRASKVILLADSRKMGTRSFVNAGRLEAIDILVTDAGIDDRSVRTLERRGIKVIRAGAPARSRPGEDSTRDRRQQ